MGDVEDAGERTRALIERHLGVSLAPQDNEGYREAQGRVLDGEWLGAFAQPGFGLRTVSAVSANISAAGGAMIDEHGRADLTVVEVRNDRVELRKAYSPEPTRQFIYIGRLGDGTLAGYWYSVAHPWFRGVFSLVRSDRMTSDARERVRGHVRRWSWRKSATTALAVCLIVLLGVARRQRWLPLVIAIQAVLGISLLTVLVQVIAMHRLANRWRRDLDSTAGQNSAIRRP